MFEFMMIFNTSSLKNGKKLARNEEMQVAVAFLNIAKHK